MSKKRTSAESCNSLPTEEQAFYDGAASADVPQDDNAKRSKLTTFSDTTLQDLPIELIECILIKVVAMEVKSTKLSKSVWKEKGELVINRLAGVCLQWSSVLSTGVFRNRLNRALKDQGTIRLEILQQFSLPFTVSSVTALRDEVFVLCPRYLEDHYINVYDCYNMAKVKYVIPLTGLSPERIVACTVSNCVYIRNREIFSLFSIRRITRDNDHWSAASDLMEEIGLNRPESIFCVTANGSIVISRRQTKLIPAIIVFDTNGSLQQKIWLPSDITEFNEIIPKPNGNLVLSDNPHCYIDDYYDDNDDDNDDHNDDDDVNNDDDNHDDDNDDGGDGNEMHAKLTEIDMNGTKIRQYLCSLDWSGTLNSTIVDSHGRLLTVCGKKKVQLLDSEFNLMDLARDPRLHLDQSMFSSVRSHYNSDRNETIISDMRYLNVIQCDFTVFKLKEL